jgi:hypothetical protein
VTQAYFLFLGGFGDLGGSIAVLAIDDFGDCAGGCRDFLQGTYVPRSPLLELRKVCWHGVPYLYWR